MSWFSSWLKSKDSDRTNNDDELERIKESSSIPLKKDDDDGWNTVFEFQYKLCLEMSIPNQLYDSNKKVREITMMAWIKPSKGGDLRIFDSCVAGEGFGGFGFDIYCNKIRFLGSRDDEASIQLCGQSSQHSVIIGEWNHCCFTFNCGVLKIYLNGMLDHVVNGPKRLDRLHAPVMDRMCIGHAMRGEPFAGHYEGYMSHMSIWNTELSQEQVEYCMKNHLLTLQTCQTNQLSENEHALLNLVQNNCLVYLPHMEILSNNKRTSIRNFGCDLSLDIRMCNYSKLSVSTKETAHFTSPPHYPIHRDLHWTQEMHKFLPHSQRQVIWNLLLISNRIQDGNSKVVNSQWLSQDVLEHVFTFL